MYLLKKEEEEKKHILFPRGNYLEKLSRNANSASIYKFESKPSSLNRFVPEVLLHRLMEYLFIFCQNMF